MDAAFLTDLLECSVCLEQLDTSSKVLPCQHTFCKQCLQEIVTSHKELRCPECRTLVECNIDELPCNILLIRLLEGIKHNSRFQQTPSKEKEGEEGKAVTSPSVPVVTVATPGGQVQPLPIAQVAAAQHERAKLLPKQIGFAIPCAKALYTYEAKEPGDLAFKKGDVILLKKRLDQNWFQGELNGQSGFLPASYVQVLAPMAHIVPQCKALYDFIISSNDQQDCLTFVKGDIITVIRRIDENWAEGKMTDKVGIFPVSFVQMNTAAKTIMKLSANTFSGPSRIAPPTPTSDDVQSSEETATLAGNPPVAVRSLDSSVSSAPGPCPSLPSSPSSSCSSPPVITTTAAPLSAPLSTPSHSAPISHPRSSSSQHREKRHSMAVLSSAGQQQSPAASHRHSLEILSCDGPVSEPHDLQAHSLSSMTTTVTTAVSQFNTTLIPTLVTAKGPDCSSSKGHRRVCSRKENCYSAVCIKTKEAASPIPTPAVMTSAVGVTAPTAAHCTPGAPQAASLVTPQNSANTFYVALYNYKPQKDDELELRKGDLYTVSEKCQDGWFKGTSLQSGKSGVFPGNYVHLSKPPILQGQLSGASAALASVRSVQSGKVTPPTPNSASSTQVSSSGHHHHHHHHHHTRHKSFSALAAVDLTSALQQPSSSAGSENSPEGAPSKATPAENNAQDWTKAVPIELSSVSSSHEWTAVVSPVFLQPQQQAKVLTASAQFVATTSTNNITPTANASPCQKAPLSYPKALKCPEGNHPWSRAWPQEMAGGGGSPFPANSGPNGRVDFAQQASGPTSATMAASYPVVSSTAGSVSSNQDPAGSSVINQSWHGSSLYSSLALSTASAITPPNVSLAAVEGEAIPVSAPFARNEKKKEKERVSLMKRLTSKCKSRSPPPTSNYSCDNSAFVDAPLNSSCSNALAQTKIAPYVHIRSGSCPNEAFAGQNVNHKKSSSLDGSANESVPKVVYRTKQPQPLVRERFRCIVPYPPNSELELELKVGDVVYVHRKREDGWYKGTLQRTGKTGLFPASFVDSY